MKFKLLYPLLFIALLLTLSACTKPAPKTLDEATVKKTGDNSAIFTNNIKPEKRSYDLIEDALAEKNNILPSDFTLGINKLTLTHFRGLISGKEGIILAVKQDNEWIIVFDGVYGTTKSYTCSSVAPYDFPESMIKDCLSD